MARILLTGAAGFIGYNVYRKLIQGHQVVALDSFSAFSNQQIKSDRIQDLTGSELVWTEDGRLVSDSYDFYHADIADIGQVDRIFAACPFDIVINLAAMTGVRQSISDPAEYERSNIIGFENILAACSKYGIRKVIYASSSSVYGGSAEIPFHENGPTDDPLNYYAITKKENEKAAERHSLSDGMQIVGLRFFTVYGPWTRPDMATYTFMESITNGTPIRLFNHGNMERDFTYVGDIVESIARIIVKIHESEGDGFHNIYNIGEGRPVNLHSYVHTLEQCMGIKAIIHDAPMNKEEMLVTFADCSRLEAFTGFRPATTVEEGLAKTVAWYRKYKEIPATKDSEQSSL